MLDTPTIWYDLTDFTIWRGTHTGTQRVVYQITKELKNKTNVKFCIYDYVSRVYSEVEFDKFFKEIPAEKVSNRPEVLQKNNQLLKKSYNLLAPPITDKIISKIRSSRINSVHGSSVLPVVTVPFSENDTLVVLGGNWDKPYFIDTLKISVNMGVNLIHNINDLIPIYDKGHVSADEHVRYEKYMKQVIKLSKGLIAISEYTKKDIVRYCKSMDISCPPVYVMRLGDDPISKISQKRVDKVPDEYVLSVSTIEVRKNHMLLYYVYKEAIRQGIELPTLILAGRRGWLTGDLQFMLTHDKEVNEKIVIVEGPSDEELSWLYSNCLFTIYPSFYEGWGLPVAESLMYGKTCLASNSTSVPEIAKDLVDYFSPYNSQECLIGIQKLLDKKYLNNKNKLIQDNYKPTLWSETSEKLHSEIEKVI